MSSSTDAKRELTSDKAQRIISAMRKSIGELGPAGATFDNVAREAGVSRGLLHYYFGSKERLMIEVIRGDVDIRMNLLEASFADAHSVDDIVNTLVVSLKEVIERQPGFYTIIFEMLNEARRNPEIATEMASFQQKTRGRLADLLKRREQEGLIKPATSTSAAAAALFAIGNGLAMEILGDPEAPHDDSIAAASFMARALLGGSA